MKYIVYYAKSPSNKYYIGITSQGLKERKRKHYNKANNGSITKFHYALKKYEDDFVWKILYKCNDYEKILEKEKFYIKKYNSLLKGYNLTFGGEGCLGYKLTKKTKIKLSKAFSKTKNPMYGKTHSKIVRLKMSKNRPKKKIYCVNNSTVYESISLAAKKLNLSVGNVGSVLKGRYKQTNGYVFKYVGDQNASF